MKNKRLWILIALIIILPVAYYLISPIFRVIEVQEQSPLINSKIKDSMNAMDSATKAEFEKQVDLMKNQITVTDDSMPAAELISQGAFKARAHEVEGKALLVRDKDKRILRFEDFETINGPNLHIYLSSELGDDDFLDLGKIKATKGNVNYEIPENVDLERYSKVLVWCVPFGVLFSYAELN
jgi:hypothetical protein